MEKKAQKGTLQRAPGQLGPGCGELPRRMEAVMPLPPGLRPPEGRSSHEGAKELGAQINALLPLLLPCLHQAWGPGAGRTLQTSRRQCPAVTRVRVESNTRR